MSVVTRSLVYFAAMGHGNRLSAVVIGIEMLYVTLTAGLYAGLQQKALTLRRRWQGDICIVLLVPGLSQLLDWWIHLAAGAAPPRRALASAVTFTLVSALFHRHVMRHGTLLAGEASQPLVEDFRSMLRLVVSFLTWPVRFLRSLPARFERVADKQENFEAAA